MLIKAPSDILPSEITPREVFEQRREFIKRAALGSLSVTTLAALSVDASAQKSPLQKLAGKPNPAYRVSDKMTALKDAATYNNFYEFGTDKSDPGETAGSLKPRPWSVTVDGLVKNPKTYDVDALMKLAPIEERIYRLRCVEGWSMVIPWLGFPLSELIRQVEPTSDAKYIEFVSLADDKQMPGLRSHVLNWPYREGLRMDEANHPLTLLTFGMYGEVLPNQSGAPVRVIVPWKYGFKSAKSIVKISFTSKQPLSSWNESAPQEYGFYSNVNPTVDHPRWSQATERRIGEDSYFSPKRKTLMFNGYEAQVASMYAGMDLKKFF